MENVKHDKNINDKSKTYILQNILLIVFKNKTVTTKQPSKDEKI
jgi:hypothetical protein